MHKRNSHVWPCRNPAQVCLFLDRMDSCVLLLSCFPSVKSLHVVLCSLGSFILKNIVFFVEVRCTADGHSHRFQFVVMMSSVVFYRCFWVTLYMHFVGYMLGAELLGPKSICSFNFVDFLVDTSSFSQFAEPISPPTGSILASTQCFPALFLLARSWWLSKWSFVCLLAFPISSLSKCLFISFTYFPFWLSNFIWLSDL